jgi:hypothetical protein
MTPNIKLGLMAGSFIALGAAAITGWVRKAESPAVPYTYNASAIATPAPATTTTTYDQFGQPANYGQPSSYAAARSATYTSASPVGDQCQYPSPLPAYGGHHYVRTVRARTVVVPASEGYADRYEEVHVRHKRSTAKSAAIVAGSAGVGAAIGAIAGGGKGAGIGALAGGAGGFIYDRLTHNH